MATSKELQAQIITKVEQGYSVSAVAKEYSLTPSTVYAWIKAKESKGLHLVSNPKLSPEEEIDLLCKEFLARVKGVMLKQIQEKIRGMNLV